MAGYERNDDPDKWLRRKNVAELYLKGQTLREIGRGIGVHYSTVCRDLELVRQEWVESSIRDFDEARSVELAKIDAVERELWEAWEKSKKDEEIKTVEQTANERRSRIQRKRQTGNPVYMTGVMRCIETRIKLLGLAMLDDVTVNMQSAGELASMMDLTIGPPSLIA